MIWYTNERERVNTRHGGRGLLKGREEVEGQEKAEKKVDGDKDEEMWGEDGGLSK